MIDRRVFIGALASGLLAAPLAAEAQPVGRLWKIGVLWSNLASLVSPAHAARRAAGRPSSRLKLTQCLWIGSQRGGTGRARRARRQRVLSRDYGAAVGPYRNSRVKISRSGMNAIQKYPERQDS